MLYAGPVPDTKTAVPGCYGQLRDRIVPAGVPSVCDAVVCPQLSRRHDTGAHVKAIVADTLASGPFEAFLTLNNYTTARLLLNFWRDAQVFCLFIYLFYKIVQTVGLRQHSYGHTKFKSSRIKFCRALRGDTWYKKNSRITVYIGVVFE